MTNNLISRKTLTNSGMSVIFLLWLLGSPAFSLRIIQTDSKDFLPDLSGQAQILDSGLAGYDEVTVCARFLTFQFNCPPEAYDYQVPI